MQLKLYKYLIGTYGVILLVSLALFYLLPKTDLADLAFSAGEAEEYENYHGEFWGEDPERLEGVYRYKQWHLDYEGDCLEIVSGGTGEAPITVSRTAAGTGKITAIEYRKEGFPCEDRLIPYQLDLTGNRLTVRDPGRYEFHFRTFIRDLLVDQFREKNEFQFHRRIFREFDFFQGLHLHIPAGVELVYDPHNIFLIILDEE